MLLSVEPFTIVALTVRPGVLAMTVFFIVLVLALVPSAIGPGVDSAAVKLIVLPFTNVDSTVRPPVLSLSFYVVVDPGPYVH